MDTISLDSFLKVMAKFEYMTIDGYIVDVPAVELKADDNHMFMDFYEIPKYDYMEFIVGNNKEISVRNNNAFALRDKKYYYHIIRFIEYPKIDLTNC